MTQNVSSEQTRVALVTGGNRGIGLEVCRQLTQKGLRVILTSRDDKKGRAAQSILKQSDLDVDYCRMDVADPESVRIAAAYAAQNYGRLDVIINNAGILPDNDTQGQFTEISILETRPEKIVAAFQTNTMGAIEVCRHFVPLMKKHRYGRIVNVSSLIAQLKTMDSGTPAYRISKVALNAVTRILADELKDQNILCNSISPGWVKTDMGGPTANISVGEAATAIVKLACLPDDGPTGQFIRNGKEIDW